jgi:hypothetical protein
MGSMRMLKARVYEVVENRKEMMSGYYDAKVNVVGFMRGVIGGFGISRIYM